MSRADNPAGGSGRSEAVSWRKCVPELCAAGFLVLVTCLAAAVYAGFGTAVAVAAGWGIACLVLLPTLTPSASPPLVEPAEWRGQGHTSFLGFWRKRGILHDATASAVGYDLELRPTLQHLLAARLAERHGISLYNSPDAARSAFLAGSRGSALWFWLDPARPAETDQRRPGPPPRILSAILDRLEQL